jgi:hypothetical protein
MAARFRVPKPGNRQALSRLGSPVWPESYRVIESGQPLGCRGLPCNLYLTEKNVYEGEGISTIRPGDKVSGRSACFHILAEKTQVYRGSLYAYVQ